jgi:hypothetical protein
VKQRQRLHAVLCACLSGLALGWSLGAGAQAADELLPALQAQYAQEVRQHLELPPPEQQDMAQALQAALDAQGLGELAQQHVVMVDRNPHVQAVFVFLRLSGSEWQWIGASPASTGRVGSFDHFRTPLGVFAHTPANPDFRAEGTFNENHVRGYGVQGMRVFDFGWVMAERGWGAGGRSPMRLQMHATDPDVLEPRLGRPDSKGCIRIPASLNVYLDRRGVLDLDYEQALARGEPMWVMRADRMPTSWPGRYLVVIDSNAKARPAWTRIGKR